MVNAMISSEVIDVSTITVVNSKMRREERTVAHCTVYASFIIHAQLVRWDIALTYE